MFCIFSEMEVACNVVTHVVMKYFTAFRTDNTVFPGPKDALFFPEKCDLNSTWVSCAEGKYYFQTYKYPYIYYTTSLS